jgi:nitrite reductase/ring-hydroxylating ferredoxin subunit
MKESTSKPLCKACDVSDTGTEVMIHALDGAWFAMLFKRNDHILAYRNACPHQGRNLNWAPDRFLFSDEGQLVCAHHGACFDLATGECTQGPCKGHRLEPVPVSVRDGEVWLTPV